MMNILFILVFLIILIVTILLYDYNNYYNNHYNNAEKQQNKSMIDDVSGLNSTTINKIIYPISLEHIQNTIIFAKKNGFKISTRGKGCSMGGHTMIINGLIIDMRHINKIVSIDLHNNLLTVQSGATWDKIIKYLDQYGLSPYIMQSYATFSIGGSISANIHGITNDYTIAKSIVQIKLINRFGELLVLDSRDILFSLVIGGYGLFGIIYEVVLKVVPNVKLISDTSFTDLSDYKSLKDKILGTTGIKMIRINLHDMDKIIIHTLKPIQNTSYYKSYLPEKPSEFNLIESFFYKWMLSNNIQNIRYYIEKAIGKPLDVKTGDETDRNKYLYVGTNSITKLYSPFLDINKSHILQEFFIPDLGDNLVKFTEFLQKCFINKKYSGIVLLNITIRYVIKDTIAFLKYAPTNNMYAFVLFYRINRDDKTDKLLHKINKYLTTYTLSLNGSFYLPYRHHYDKQDLIKAYPNIIDFFKLKLKYDPDEMFTNLWYEKYKL